VPKAVAEAMEVPERPDELLADTLTEVLGSRELLLVVDNCEHLLEATARLVDVLLDSCPRLRVLATTREGLGGREDPEEPSSCATRNQPTINAAMSAKPTDRRANGFPLP